MGAVIVAFVVGVVLQSDDIYMKKASASPCRQTTPETDGRVVLLRLEKAVALFRVYQA